MTTPPATPLNPLICGRWDGVHVWLQWNPVDGAVFEVQLRYAPAPKNAGDAPAWEPWKGVGGAEVRACWMSIATWREGCFCQARVRVKPAEGAEDGWEVAADVRFTKSLCRFEISTSQKPLYFQKGHFFACAVDGAACGYVLDEEMELAAGETKEVSVTANVSSGWHQLDHENHFDLRPSLGVRIRNLAPSEQDVATTGMEVTLIHRVSPDGPLLMVFGKRNF